MPKLNQIRLAALDLDGTLLNEDFILTNAVQASVRQAREAGLQVVVVTGRDRRSAQPFLGQLGLDETMITSGGALVWLNGQIFSEIRFTSEQINDILAIGTEYGTGFFVDHTDQTWRLGNRYYLDLYAHVSDSILVDRLETVREPLPIKVSLIQEREILVRIRTILKQKHPALSLVFPFEHVMDVNPSGANKGKALAILAAALGISMSDIAAVGDSDNDLSMFALAGVSYAMQNAPQHVRQAADHVVPPNDRDGVVYALGSILSEIERR